MKIRKRKITAITGMIAVVLLISVFIFQSHIKRQRNSVSVESENERCISFLESFGWKVTEEPVEILYMKLPTEFNDVWRQYNELQQNQGFELEAYKGKEIRKRSYGIIDYPGLEKDTTIKADILICGSEIIGADICSVRADGFIHGVNEIQWKN